MQNKINIKKKGENKFLNKNNIINHLRIIFPLRKKEIFIETNRRKLLKNLKLRA